MKSESFGSILSRLRKNRKLSNSELAKLASVPRSLIAGLQSGRRKIGEFSAKKIGAALGLNGADLEAFIFSAIDTCTEKVLKESKDYPSSLINHLPVQLGAHGISPELMNSVAVNGASVEILLNDGRTAFLETTLAYA